MYQCSSLQRCSNYRTHKQNCSPYQQELEQCILQRRPRVYMQPWRNLIDYRQYFWVYVTYHGSRSVLGFFFFCCECLFRLYCMLIFSFPQGCREIPDWVEKWVEVRAGYRHFPKHLHLLLCRCHERYIRKRRLEHTPSAFSSVVCNYNEY